uniref:Phage protein n=1 Tax=Ascaris lumbricoides TaxID=6252 RepID=A0A0M3HJI3_ASCLU
MQIHVSDTSGEIAKLLDSSMIEKYNISDEQYDQRSESIRAWKKREGLGKKTDPTSEYIENSRKIAENIKVFIVFIIFLKKLNIGFFFFLNSLR